MTTYVLEHLRTQPLVDDIKLKATMRLAEWILASNEDSKMSLQERLDLRNWGHWYRFDMPHIWAVMQEDKR